MISNTIRHICIYLIDAIDRIYLSIYSYILRHFICFFIDFFEYRKRREQEKKKKKKEDERMEKLEQVN